MLQYLTATTTKRNADPVEPAAEPSDSGVRDSSLPDAKKDYEKNHRKRKYDPTWEKNESIKMWMSGSLKPRRPWHAPYRKRSKMLLEPDSDTSESVSDDDVVSDFGERSDDFDERSDGHDEDYGGSDSSGSTVW